MFDELRNQANLGNEAAQEKLAKLKIDLQKLAKNGD